jgi:gluconolactonase
MTTFEVVSERVHVLVPPDAALEKIADGFQFTEGAVWDSRVGCLLFSDIIGNRIYRWTPGAGVSVWREPSGMSNGLTLDREGRLCACEHGNRRVSCTEADGTVTLLAERFEGKRLNSPNDLVFRSDGTLFFTDPPYGLTPPYGMEGQQAELDFHGLFRLTPAGTLIPDCKDFDRPNGLSLSPDERILYVADTSQYHVRCFDVAPDGSLSGGQVFAELRGEGGGRPDGMKVDARGNLWCTGPGGVWVFCPEGEHLGSIRVPERQTANVAWGQSGHSADEPWTWLYMTSHVSVYRLHVSAPGLPVVRGPAPVPAAE